MSSKHKEFLSKELENVDTYKPDTNYFREQWSGIQQATNCVTTWDTGLDYNLLRFIGEKSVNLPDHFVRIIFYAEIFLLKLLVFRIFIHI